MRVLAIQQAKGAAEDLGRSVMIVEDDPEMAALVRDALVRQGFRAVVEENGRDAIVATEGERFDVAIVDKELPQIDGLDLVSFLRHRDPDMAVILITAFGGALVARAALDRGAACYLEKPVRLAELVDAVHEALRRDPPQGTVPQAVTARVPLAPAVPSARSPLWAVVLAGGRGTRLLPLTRRICGEPRPKQYTALVGSRSMLGQTLDRVRLRIPGERTVVVSLREHARYLAEELRDCGAQTILPQPADRGTAAGVLLPIQWIHHRDPGATVAVFPSDHFVEPARRFMGHVAEAAAFVDRHPERILLLGALPDEAETEYGWIETDDVVGWTRSGAVSAVRRFTEKPPAETARACLARGDLWNTFVFVGKASTLVDVGRQFLWRVHSRLVRIAAVADVDSGAVRRAYATMPAANFSTDVLQNCASILAATPLTGVTWSDWGSPRRVLGTLQRLGIRPSWLGTLGIDAWGEADAH